MSAPEAKQETHSGFLSSILVNFIIGATGLATLVLLNQYLSADLVGQYVFLLVAAQAFGRITVGISGAAKRKIKQNPNRSAGYFGVVFIYLLVLIFLMLVTVLVMLFEQPQFLSELGITGPMIASMGFLVVAHGFYKTTYTLFSVSHDTSRVRVVKFILIFLLHWITLGIGGGVAQLLAAFGVGTFIIGFLLFAALEVSPSAPTGDEVVDIIRASVLTIPSALVSNFHHKLDVLIIGAVIGIAQVGVYESALRIVLPGMLIASGVSKVMSRDVQGLSPNSYDAAEAVRRTMNVTGISVTLTLALIIGLGELILTNLYSASFAQHWEVLAILGLTQLVVAFSNPYNVALRAFGRSQFVFVVRTVTFIANIPLSLYLAPEFGVIGVLIATISTEFIELASYYVMMKAHVSRTVRLLKFIKQFLIGVVVAGLGVIASGIPFFQTQQGTVAGIVAGVLVYLGLFISVSGSTSRILRERF